MLKEKTKKEHNPNWPHIPEHPSTISTIGGSGFRKTNILLNLLSHQLAINKIYSYTKDAFEEKHQI